MYQGDRLGNVRSGVVRVLVKVASLMIILMQIRAIKAILIKIRSGIIEVDDVVNVYSTFLTENKIINYLNFRIFHATGEAKHVLIKAS